MKSRLFLVTLLVIAMLLVNVSVVAAATGEVTWTNPPENTGKIKRNDDSDNGDYVYNTNAGDTNPPGWEPSVGDQVTFTPGPGQTASDVTIQDDPAGGPPFPPPEGGPPRGPRGSP